MTSSIRPLDGTAALLFSPWRWLVPRAKLLKALLLGGAALLALEATRQRGGHPVLGTLALFAEAGAALALWRRWRGEREVDLPVAWIAPVSATPPKGPDARWTRRPASTPRPTLPDRTRRRPTPSSDG